MKKKIYAICIAGVFIIAAVAAFIFYDKAPARDSVPTLDSISTTEASNLIQKEFADTLGYTEDANPLTKLIYEYFSITVTSVTGTEDDGEVHCSVSNCNVSEILTSIFSLSEAYTVETYTTALSTAFSNSPAYSKDLRVSIRKENGSFIVELTDAQFDACSGGLLTYYETLTQKGGK